MPDKNEHQNSPNIVCCKQFIYEQKRIGEINKNLFDHMGSFSFNYAVMLKRANSLPE
jgi:hypothetical protein